MSEPTEREYLEGLRYEDKFPPMIDLTGGGGRVSEPCFDAPSEAEQAARRILDRFDFGDPHSQQVPEDTGAA